MNTNPTCLFNGCVEPAHRDNKCTQHRLRAVCSVDHCHNQTYARKLCVKHGGKKQCQVDGCVSNARYHGFCCKHGAESVKTGCQVKDCTKYARARGHCVSHGGGRSCCVEACDMLARTGGLCHHHFYSPLVHASVVENVAFDTSRSHSSFDSNANEVDWVVHDMHVDVQWTVAPIDDSIDSITWSDLIGADSAKRDGCAFTTIDEQILESLMINE